MQTQRVLKESSAMPGDFEKPSTDQLTTSKSVCKNWSSLISTPFARRFTAHHLNHQCKQNPFPFSSVIGLNLEYLNVGSVSEPYCSQDDKGECTINSSYRFRGVHFDRVQSLQIVLRTYWLSLVYATDEGNLHRKNFFKTTSRTDLSCQIHH
ncbi:hypothetical protein POTOM_014850 [Populus tomentosa]|uniref:Uncharacterized protein n=1 Tax=Populus tomentosa TaxID=118781 RepID=A0A8X8A0T3_POPTO|nr:hypothetical protein POTOM_014850 [Populus tomentosa]